MRRFLSLFTMLMLCGVLAFAQSRVVSGKVTDADGNPVSFASVKVKGTNTGVSADANGAYSLKVNPNSTLVISGAGFKETEVPVGTQTVLSTVMEKNAAELVEVVVTGAMGIKTTSRATASNAQVISAEKLNTVRETDLNNAIAGKAGVQVRSQSNGKLGTSSAVRLRGENGLSDGGAGPIYVIDGTIYTNGSADITPDDIEDLTILQGPAAAARFGADGINGAIVITSKKGRKTKGVGIEINSGITYDQVYVLPKYQNSYAGGDGALAQNDMMKYNYKAGDPVGWKALDGKYYHDYVNDASWGPRIAGQEYIPWYAWYPGSEYSFKTATLTPQPNNIKDFYDVGVTKNNNINFSKAGDGYNVRVSYTNLDIKSIIPTQWLKRNTLSTSLSLDLGSRFTVAANINYVAQNRDAENDDGYGNQTSGSFSSWFHRDLDMNKTRELRNLTGPDGGLASWNHPNPGGNPSTIYTANYWFNFYSYLDNISNLDRKDRLFGDASITFKATNALKFKLTYRKQQLTSYSTTTFNSILQKSITQSQASPYEGNQNAAYGVASRNDNRQNIEGLFSYNKKFKNFAVNLYPGFDILKQYVRTYNANTKGGLIIPDLYALSNSVAPVTNSFSGSGAQEAVSSLHRNSVFVSGDFSFRNFIFVEGSFRRDYLSTEAPSKPYIDAKSAGVSFVFSDLTKKAIPFISFGKIRASYGQVISPLAIYQLNPSYTLNANQWNAQPITTEPNSVVAPGFHGSTNNEAEVGLEMRFAKSRFGFSATYFDRKNLNFPVNINITSATGYTALSTNAGEIRKKGVELQGFITPVRSKNVTWELSASWSKLLKNTIVTIKDSITGLNLASGQGSYAGSYAPYISNQVGQEWGQLYGIGKKRINGVPVLDNTGRYVKEDNVNFGSVLPDYTGGVQSSLTLFKNFTVNINIDYSWGGKFFSLSDYWGSGSGLTARTAGLNDKGNPVRDAVADGGGIHVSGVDGTGKAVDYYLDARAYFHQFQDGTHISEESIYDLSFVKMREVSLGYRIPVERLGLGKYVTNATFSILMKNPWLMYSKIKDQDPSEISGIAGENGQIPGTRSIGVNLKLGF